MKPERENYFRPNIKLNNKVAEIPWTLSNMVHVWTLHLMPH